MADDINVKDLKEKYKNVFFLNVSRFLYARELRSKTLFVLTDAEVKRIKESNCCIHEHIEKIKSELINKR